MNECTNLSSEPLKLVGLKGLLGERIEMIRNVYHVNKRYTEIRSQSIDDNETEMRCDSNHPSALECHGGIPTGRGCG